MANEMKDDFLNKVRKAVKNLGTAPYDDQKTREAISEATRKVVEYCNELKKK